jgi:YHS domain-containing protein
MKHFLRFLSVLALVAGSAFSADAPNKDCPVTGKPAVAANKTVYTKTVALCCNKCKTKFDETPKAYLSSLLSAHAGQCPLSKKAITTPVNVTYKREVSFCSAECKTKFEAAPDKFIRDVR